MGVQSCGRPTHRSIDSHTWKHKKNLPSSFKHGSVLLASCWAERYRLVRGSSVVHEEKLQCVSGQWYNSLEKPSLQGLFCEPCVHVGARGYAAYHTRNEQELYFFNRMALSVYTELGMITELSAVAKHKHCLQPSEVDAAEMTVVASAGCSANLLAQVNSLSTPTNRHLRIIPSDMTFSGNGECLSARGSLPGLIHHQCNQTDEKQLLSPAEIPSDIWALHVKADERSHDFHKAYSSYCGTSGALTNLDFGQIFVGDANHITTKCKFAPLVNFGSFVDTEIVRDKTSSNWPNWYKMLADNPVECESGEALTAFKLDSGKQKYKFECSKIGGLGSCFDYYSAQVEVPHFHEAKAYWEKPMRMLQANCGENSVLGGFHFEFSEGGRWQRIRYKCCKAGGAPVTMDPRGQVPDLVSPFDGVFCPSQLDASGRFKYQSADRVLAFDRDVGKWCLGSSCSKITNQASPLEVPGADFDVVNVSDFDGEFLAAGVPNEAGAKPLSVEDALMLKPPRRPQQPWMPELEEFKAEQPKYASECLNYENLWKEVSETFTNEEDEEVMTISKLEAEPATKEATIPDYHPCEVAKNAGGIFGPYGGGDGSTAPENMMYSDWNDCMQGDIERDLASATAGYHGALSGFIMDMVEEGLGAVCSAIPDVMIAPFGAGVALNPGEICGQVAELVGAIKTFAGPASEFHFAKKEYDIQKEGYAACNPLQIGFARAFCDIHCVRDAVIRGDRSIIRNLELATKKTNSNLQKMVKWSVDAARTETGWLADKLDYMHAINFAFLSDIKNKLTPETGLQEVKKTTERMFDEMQGYAEAASFDELSRLTAKDALENFLHGAEAFERLNATEAANATSLLPATSLLKDLDALHQTLRRASRGRSRSEILSRQMEQQVTRLQQMARKQLNTLGVYRLESNASATHRRHLATMVETASLDRIWWQFRVKLDAYLDIAEAEVKSFQKSLEELASYNECKSVFSSLMSTYTKSMRLMSRSHRQLRSTWREASGLLRELASVVVDTDAFGNFIRD